MSEKPQVRRIYPDPTDDEKQAAFDAEAAIAVEAAELRRESTELTIELWTRLRPLLLKPFHRAFIVALSAGEGKPYASEGIRSVHVQQHRMDGVLTPFWWREVVAYEEGARVCRVVVEVGPKDAPIFSRESRGGVERAQGLGNHYKGSYTNSAKLAFAKVGPGQHVYMGAADLDPDTDADAAKNQAAGAPLDAETVQRVLAGLASVGLSDEEISRALADVGLDSPDGMARTHAMKLRELVDVRPAGDELVARVREARPLGWDERRFKLALASVGVNDNSDVDAALKSLTVGAAEALVRMMEDGK